MSAANGRKKLWFVIDDLEQGGTSNQVLELSKGLREDDLFDICVCYLGEGSHSLKRVFPQDIRIRFVHQRGKIDILALLKLYLYFVRGRPDIVHTFLFTADCYGRLAAAMAGVRAIISSQRNVDLWKDRRHRLADTWLARFTARFIANANEVKKYLVERMGIDASRIDVVYNGIDCHAFQKGYERPDARAALGIPPGKTVILNIARFSPQKDHETLLEAAEIVLSKRRDVLFVLIGLGPMSDDIARRVQKKGLADSFRVVGFQKDVAGFYHRAYLSVVTSLYEGCCNFILESMASELPVVATVAGGNQELVVDGVTGYLVPTKAPRAVAEKILLLLDNPEMARRFGRDGRERIRELFSVERMVAQYRDIYLRLMQRLEAT